MRNHDYVSSSFLALTMASLVLLCSSLLAFALAWFGRGKYRARNSHAQIWCFAAIEPLASLDRADRDRTGSGRLSSPGFAAADFTASDFFFGAGATGFGTATVGIAAWTEVTGRCNSW
jgi:hypothetical protein